MKDWNQIPFFAALDWARQHHDIVVVDSAGRITESFRFAHSAEGWQQLRARLERFGPELPIAVETSLGSAVDQLLAASLQVFPVNPKQAERFRERKAPSGVKDDFLDAWSLADALRTDGQHWRQLLPQDPLCAELRLLCRDEVCLIEERTALVNQLIQCLHDYYPAALEAFDDFTQPYTWAFVTRFPTPKLLKQAGKRGWERFLHMHKLWRPETAEKRLEIFARADVFCASAVTIAAKSLMACSLAKLLLALENQIEQFRKRIRELFNQHPDHDLFGSLPGSGPKIGPRLLSEIGSNREIFTTPESLQSFAGTAPRCLQSGKFREVKIRQACNKSLRSALHYFADQSRTRCIWASVYYQQHRLKGHGHADTLRRLAQRWLKIIWKMWQTHTDYNEALHIQNQVSHGSWFVSFKPET